MFATTLIIVGCGDADPSHGGGGTHGGDPLPDARDCAPDCPVVNLARGGVYVPMSVAVHDERAYFVARNTESSKLGAVFVVDIGGGEAQKLATVTTASSSFCKQIAVDDEHVYFAAENDYGLSRAVRRVPLDGGPVLDLVGLNVLASCVALDEEFVIFASQTSLSRVSKDGGETTVLAEDSVLSLVVQGDYAYYSTSDAIKRAPIAGGGSIILAGELRGTTALAVTEDSLYAIDGERSAIIRVPMEGGTPEVMLEDVERADALVASDTALYWAYRPIPTEEHAIFMWDFSEHGHPVAMTVGAADLALAETSVVWVSESEAAVRKMGR